MESAISLPVLSYRWANDIGNNLAVIFGSWLIYFLFNLELLFSSLITLYSTVLSWLYWCLTALQHFSDHFGHGWLDYPHCSWASLLGSLPVLSAHSFFSNWQLPFLDQQEENSRRNYFMTNLHKRTLLNTRIEPATICIPVGCASDQATTLGYTVLRTKRFLVINFNTYRMDYQLFTIKKLSDHVLQIQMHTASVAKQHVTYHVLQIGDCLVGKSW